MVPMVEKEETSGDEPSLFDASFEDIEIPKTNSTEIAKVTILSGGTLQRSAVLLP